jgi:hypothetical protein
MEHRLSNVVIATDGEIEEWRPIPRAPGYEISNFGNVRSVDRSIVRTNGHGPYVQRSKGKPLKASESCYGYLVISCNRRQRPVHILVLEAFKGPKPSSRHQTRHLDGNKMNNHWRNLEWGTPKENSEDRVLHGTQSHLRGEELSSAKISEEQVRQLRLVYRKRGRRHVPLGESFGLNRKEIWNICNRRRWSHVG